MPKILTTKSGKRLYQDDKGIIYQYTTGKNPGRTLANYRNGKYVGGSYNLPSAIKGNNVRVRTYDEESAKQILKVSGIPKSKAQIQREKQRVERMKNAPDLNQPIKVGNFEYNSGINIPKRSDLTTKKNSNNKSTTTTKQTAKTPENNYVMRRDNNSTITQPKTTKQSTTKSTNTTSTVTTPKRTSSRVSSSTPDGNYTVSRGDSLWKIAHNAGISLNELMRQNPQIKNINQVIYPGDKINVNGRNNNINTSTQSTKSSTPTTSNTNYENIVLDDSKMETNINTTPSQEQLTTPDKLEPIKYNYKKKKR